MIDIHTHAIPSPAAAEPVDPSVYRLERLDEDSWDVFVDDRRVRTVGSASFDTDARIRLMATDGVDRQLVSPTPFLFRYAADLASGRALARVTNGAITEMVVQAPDQLSGLGTVTLQDTELAVEDFHDVMDRGLLGIEIGTHLPKRELGDPELDRLWSAADEAAAIVFIHPWTSRLTGVSAPGEQFALGYPAATATAFAALVSAQLTRRFPRIRWLLAHGGGCAGSVVGRLDQAGRQLNHPYAGEGRASPMEVLRDCYVDGLVYVPEQVAALVALVGSEQILLGTDFPFDARERPPGAAVAAAANSGLISDVDAALIREGNARRLLGSARRP